METRSDADRSPNDPNIWLRSARTAEGGAETQTLTCLKIALSMPGSDIGFVRPKKSSARPEGRWLGGRGIPLPRRRPFGDRRFPNEAELGSFGAAVERVFGTQTPISLGFTIPGRGVAIGFVWPKTRDSPRVESAGLRKSVVASPARRRFAAGGATISGSKALPLHTIRGERPFIS